MKTSRKKENGDSGKFSSKTQNANIKSDSPHSKRHQLYIKKGVLDVSDKNDKKDKTETPGDMTDTGRKNNEKNEIVKKTTKKRKVTYQSHLFKERCKEMKQERVEERRKSIFEFLKEYEEGGVRLSIGGRAYTAERISEIMSVAEPPWYMPDIKLNEEGKVININYDRISED